MIVAVLGEELEREIGRFLGGGGFVVLTHDAASARALLEQRLPGADLLPGDLEVDLRQHRVLWQGRKLELSETEVQILGALAETPLRVWSFAELTVRAWDRPYFGDSSCLRSAVKRLRAKLLLQGAMVSIEAARGVGFRLAV